MNETHREDPHAPLSYYGARRIVWLIFFIFIIWLILRALQPVILLFALVFLLAMVLNPIVVWLQKHRVPRVVGVIMVMLALIAVTTTVILFAIPPLSRQLQELMHSTPNMWQSIRSRIESLTQNYPQVREALPRTDEMASKVGAAAATVGNFLLQSTLGLVGGVASALLAILLLVFLLANPRPLVAAYLALAPDRYREQARRTLERMMRQMIAWRGASRSTALLQAFRSVHCFGWLACSRHSYSARSRSWVSSCQTSAPFSFPFLFCWSHSAWARQNSGWH
jgi:predicted PurR-regulated permease PerM